MGTKGTISSVKIYNETGIDGGVYASWSIYGAKGVLNKDVTDICSGYKVVWYWYSKDAPTIKREGESTEINNGNERISSYTPPSNAIAIQCKVTPKSKTHTVNKKKVKYFTPKAKSSAKKYLDDVVAPVKPSPPNITNDKDGLRLSFQTNDEYAHSVQFYIYKAGYNLDDILDDGDEEDDVVSFNERVVGANYGDIPNIIFSPALTIGAGYVEWKTPVPDGSKYVAKCRTISSIGVLSVLSDASSVVSSGPIVPTNVRAELTTLTEALVSWDLCETAKTYTLEYTTETRYFDSSERVTQKTGITNSPYIISLGESGHIYYIRIKAVTEDGVESGWSEVVQVMMADKPNPPTTWSSVSTATVGEDVYLYWSHNSTDSSHLELSTLECVINSTKFVTYYLPNERNEKDRDKPFEYKLVGDFGDGATIEWRVKTKGLSEEESEWSVRRTIKIYSKPTVTIGMNNYITDYPIKINIDTNPYIQTPVAYSISIVSNEAYSRNGPNGESESISVGTEVYNAFIDPIRRPISLELTPGDLLLEDQVEYTIYVDVAMDSGLMAEGSLIFTTNFGEDDFDVDATVIIDEEEYYALIRPVSYDLNVGVEGFTSQLYTENGIAIYNEDRIALYGTEDGQRVPPPNLRTTISVYRINYDGSLTLIEDDVPSTGEYVVVDPHPTLTFARYRIVGRNTATGKIVYYDLPDIEVGCTSIIVTWGETWEGNVDDEAIIPQYSGNRLILPYNVDLNESSNKDKELIEYIGRSRPVAYYGTHLGENIGLKSEIPYYDRDTVQMLRRFKRYLGVSYVREPKGGGYWAHVDVSFDINHCATTIPISLTVVPVDGGM